jgi:hypothetical protein
VSAVQAWLSCPGVGDLAAAVSVSADRHRLFGRADPDGVFGGYGAPRWKQRALYDAMKDAAAAVGQVRLARISIYDTVEDVVLNDVLYRRAHVSADAIADLVNQRTAGADR